MDRDTFDGTIRALIRKGEGVGSRFRGKRYPSGWLSPENDSRPRFVAARPRYGRCRRGSSGQ